MASNEELALQVQQGDSAATETLWEAVKKLCYKIAADFFNHYTTSCTASGITLDDLQQESFFAMLNAANAFDPDKGYKFTTYLHYPLQNCFKALAGVRSGTAPRPLNGADSLDKPLDDSDESGSTRGDLIPDPAAEAAFQDAEQAEFEQQLHKAVPIALAGLPDETRKAVTLHHMEGATYKATGERLGVPTERARQLCSRGLHLLRHPKRSRILLGFVDYEQGYSCTSFEAWKSGGSVEERLIERADRRKRRQKDKDIELRARLDAEREAWYVQTA
ncbi:MAG: sigma-70 family RNA polymerase sigma factor [Oscillospiraceae bacterium]|jgi:RNA polymerase sigma factor (sigma-70 family)|nr:sigma-70 family RNA polymerase sigma factor [Oscillospiraceae bacterium]